MTYITIDGDYWRRRAEQARAMAGEITTGLNQHMMRMLAEEYDRLAEAADHGDGQESG